MANSNWGAFAITLAGAFALIGTGLVYILTWLNYDDDAQPPARWLAASVPLLMSLRFAAVGCGLVQEPRLVASSTRHGRPSELLAGPLQYGITHTVLTLVWWRQSPAALVGICMMCAGDGAAEVAGRAAGRHSARIMYNRQKTVIGSCACAVASFLVSLPIVMLFNARGSFDHTLTQHGMLRGCAVCAVAAAVVESLPIKELDNITVPLTTALLAAYGAVFDG